MKSSFWITLVLAILLFCQVSEGEEETLYFTIDEPVKHQCEIWGMISWRYPIELEYSDMMVFAQDYAYDKWLDSITAKDFIEKYCVINYSGITELKENKEEK